MKIALVHDYIKEYGGAERVLEELSDLYPQAKIYTSLYRPQFLGPHRQRLEKKWQGRVVQSWFNLIPFAHKLISPLRLLSPLAFRFLVIGDCDLVLSSATGAYFPNALKKGAAKLLCYCHTPPRYLYGYPTARMVTNPVLVFIIDLLNHFLRLLDFKLSRNVDQYIANSREVSARIQKFYRRDSVVINPPIDLPKMVIGLLNIEKLPVGDYYLTGGRLAQSKRFDLAILACIRLGRPLLIFGRDFGGNLSRLQELAQGHSNIQFLGEITTLEKNQLLSQAKAYLNPGQDEDFGMTIPEAMALGCPVIAHASGGPLETVTDKTGLLFTDHSPKGLARAILDFEKLTLKKEDCVRHAQHFSQKVFRSKIKATVQGLF